MDMFINSWDAILFTDYEVDLLEYAIEDVIYTEFFKNPHTMMAIHCVGYDEEEDSFAIDQPIHCRNKFSTNLKDICKSVAIDVFYQKFCEERSEEEIGYRMVQGGLDDFDVALCATFLRLPYGDIIIYGAAGLSLSKELRVCQFELGLLIYLIIASRDNGIDTDFVGQIIGQPDDFLTEEERKKYFNTMIDLLRSDKPVAVKWRNN